MDKSTFQSRLPFNRRFPPLEKQLFFRQLPGYCRDPFAAAEKKALALNNMLHEQLRIISAGMAR